jgi:NAD(P)-dependent dehydrogenase (short-subunit alcohol dehydrogenase family)
MITNFTDADVPDQRGKTIFITGANTGIGFECAMVLAGKGARVLLGCRSPEKAEAARQRIVAAHPQADVVLVPIDLGDLASVRSAAGVVAAEARLDVLINNAGIMMAPRALTQDGFESQLGVNHLGPFLLTSLLLPKLEATPHSRIVNTSSNAHKAGNIDFDDLSAERSYSALGRYNQSKLANLLHTFELNRQLRERGSSALAVTAHPGATDTDLVRHLPTFVVNWVLPIVRPMFNKPHEGAWPTLLAATAPDVEGGQYFGPGGFGEFAGPARQVKATARANDDALAAKLWQVSAELVGA